METIIHKHFIEPPDSKGEIMQHGTLPLSSLGSFASLANAEPPAPPQPNPRQRWLKMATGDVDRAGDILVIEGMDADNFLKNPQFLWQHGASGSIVNTIGRILDIKQSNGALYALAEYATPEISPLAEQVYQLDLAGLMPANSIGFRPIEYEANSYGGHTFTEWELVECSKVELPMNPDAVDSAKSLTIEEAADWLLQ
jgi:hypothetical protein